MRVSCELRRSFLKAVKGLCASFCEAVVGEGGEGGGGVEGVEGVVGMGFEEDIVLGSSCQDWDCGGFGEYEVFEESVSKYGMMGWRLRSGMGRFMYAL